MKALTRVIPLIALSPWPLFSLSTKSEIDLLSSYSCSSFFFMFMFCYERLNASAVTSCLFFGMMERPSLYPSPYYFFNFIWLPTVLRTPWVMIPILWHKASAYSIIWVVRKRDRFNWHLARTSHIWRRLSGSSPVVGSSRKTIRGSPTRDIAIESLLFIPPERDEARKCLNFVRLTSYIAWWTLTFRSRPGIPLSLA